MKNDVPEQLAISREELQAIRAELASRPLLQPVCHHFSCPPESHWDEAEEKARLSALVPALSRHGLDVDTGAGAMFVQAWELVRPSEEWADRTVRKLCEIADEAGFEYGGWTWEPAGRPSFLSRVKSGALILAPILTILLAIKLGFSWFYGELSAGSSVDVGLWLLGAITFIAVASLLFAAYLEWEESRKYR